MVVPLVTELSLHVLFDRIHPLKVLRSEDVEDTQVVCELEGPLTCADGSGDVYWKLG